VIAGKACAVDKAIELCKEAGAKRALPLNVSVPSHCALMLPAAEKLEEELMEVQMNAPSIPVVQNVNAGIAKEPAEIKENLIKQLSRPVLWLNSVQLIHKTGVNKVVECGPGKVLSGLIRRIESEIQCFGSDSNANLDSAVAEMTG
ncbi:MAG: malonyl CoA-acyl carrier protein transacylase, partial [Gammaproteobacteria bacterium]|nr:malonyl CoA-acyl carrier protein transacylase [Gammaproteobacteria bacterium]